MEMFKKDYGKTVVLLEQEIIITVVFQETVIMDMVFIIGVQEKNMQVTGKIVKNMVQVQTLGNLEINMKVNGKIIYKMAMENTLLLMEKFRKDFLNRENILERRQVNQAVYQAIATMDMEPMFYLMVINL